MTMNGKSRRLALVLSALTSLLPLSSCTTERGAPPVAGRAATGPLRLAEWNLEFLAARDGAGCRPRTAAEYQRMRSIVASIDADVFAFEEAESVEAAQRVFDPGTYVVVMENRPGKPGGTCGGGNDQPFNRQAVGFAIRRSLPFSRSPDVTDLEVGNPNLRSGVDVTVSPPGGTPIRLLAVHLKSGCFSGEQGKACPELLKQEPVVERWIDSAAAGPVRFAVLGDWNRRLALPGDAFWKEIDDGDPPNAELRLADEGAPTTCDPRYHDFIDHVVLDRRAGHDFRSFREVTFGPNDHPSDHCPIVVEVTR